jgi:hypothetical protein
LPTYAGNRTHVLRCTPNSERLTSAATTTPVIAMTHSVEACFSAISRCIDANRRSNTHTVSHHPTQIHTSSHTGHSYASANCPSVPTRRSPNALGTSGGPAPLRRGCRS